MKINKSKDGIQYIDEVNSSEKVIFNLYSWLSLIKGIIINYANKSESEAESLLSNSSIVNSPIDTYMAVCIRSHESEYHWAMLIAFGDQYWLKGISQDEPDDYFEWEAKFKKDKGLAEEIFIFSD